MQTYSDEFYLIASRRTRGSGSLKVRVTDRSPALAVGEVAMRVSLQLPQTLFQRPQLSASIKVPTDQVSAPEITAAVASNIGDIVKQQTGLDLKITIEAPS